MLDSDQNRNVFCMGPENAFSMEPEILEGIRERTVKNFIDLLILAELNNGHTMSSHDVVTTIHNNFHIKISPGTVYSVMYSLERNGLIEGIWKSRKRVYTLTDKGEETIKTIKNVYERIQILVAQLFGA